MQEDGAGVSDVVTARTLPPFLLASNIPGVRGPAPGSSSIIMKVVR
jgi:hypothetical protein